MLNSDEDTVSEQAQDWVVRLASGDMTDDELADFETWLGRSNAHARAFADERRFWNRLSPLGETFDRLDREAGASVPTRREPREAKAGRTRRRYAVCVALVVAACLLAYVSGPSLITRLQADYVSGFDRVVSVRLPDGSRVTLNRDSAIRVDFGATARNVMLLRGEIYTEVEPDTARPFRVAAGHGVSEAVGTAYAVGLVDGRTRVAVTEGRVVVTGAAEPGLSVSLVAGEGVRYADGRLLGVKFPVNGDDALAWRQDRIIFVDRPLRDALSELERYHRGRIVLLGESRAYRPVSGVIDLQKLDDGIAALAATHGLRVVHLTPYLTVLR
jgi:transmembrane sensor